SHLRSGIEWIADTDRLGRLNEEMFKSVSDLFQQDEPLGSQTHLARVMKSALDASLDSFWDIRIFTDDERIRSAQFHHRLLDDFPRLGGHGGARTHTPGYGSALNTRVIDDVDHVLSFEDEVLKHPFWKTGLQHDALELDGAPLRVPGVFHENDVAGQDRRN